MTSKKSQLQSGFAIIIVLILLMGIGGVALTAYTRNLISDVETKKFQHNQRVLSEAKQAVLQYAYNRPVNSSTGRPGRILCPDMADYDGEPNSSFNCKDGAPMVGRLPWKEKYLNFYDARDADGERLWFAVSEKFAYAGTTKVNSDEPLGTISIYDQSGQQMHAGTNRVAAVIIAPGAAITRDNYTQVRITAANQTDAANYLDKFGSLDNMSFDNGNKGFVVGPVYRDGKVIVNDQIIVITADEVREVAEKATLQTYQAALRQYQKNTGVGVATYPWLDDYSTTNLTKFDAVIGSTRGRLPSIFGRYFSTNQQRTEEIISEVSLQLSIQGAEVYNDELPNAATKIRFETDGKLRGDMNPDYKPTINRYFWDDKDAPDGWELCPPVTGDHRDCKRDSSGNIVSDPYSDSNQTASRVLHVELKLDFSSGFDIVLNYSPAPTRSYAAATTSEHARIYASFAGNKVSSGTIRVRTEQDDNYLNSFDTDGLADHTLNSSDTVIIGLRYYPELPYWVKTGYDNWHNSIQMVYATRHAPGGTANCIPGDSDLLKTCLTLLNSAGTDNNKNALLILASQHNNMNDDNLPGYTDDLEDLFDVENADADSIYDAREPGGNDKVLVLGEQ